MNNLKQQQEQIQKLIARKQASVEYWKELMLDQELEIQALEEKADYLKKFKDMDKRYQEEEKKENDNKR